jgi:hypothetical protein
MLVLQALFEHARVLEEDQPLEEDPEALYPLNQYQDGKNIFFKTSLNTN